MRFDNYRVADMASSEPIPEATYRLRVKDMIFNDPTNPDWKTAHPNSEAKEPFLNTTLVVMDDTEPKTGALVGGRHIFTNLTMAKGKDWLLRQLVEASGKPDDWELDTDELKDAEVMGTVTINKAREVNGRKYEAKNEVRRFTAVL
jgi:hypothetical protein